MQIFRMEKKTFCPRFAALDSIVYISRGLRCFFLASRTSEPTLAVGSTGFSSGVLQDISLLFVRLCVVHCGHQSVDFAPPLFACPDVNRWQQRMNILLP